MLLCSSSPISLLGGGGYSSSLSVSAYAYKSVGHCSSTPPCSHPALLCQSGVWFKFGGCYLVDSILGLLNGIEVFALWPTKYYLLLVLNTQSIYMSISNIHHPTTLPGVTQPQPQPHIPQFPEFTNEMIIQFNLYVLNAINSNPLPSCPITFSP